MFGESWLKRSVPASKGEVLEGHMKLKTISFGASFSIFVDGGMVSGTTPPQGKHALYRRFVAPDWIAQDQGYFKNASRREPRGP